MEETANVLLYVGTILIAFQIVGKMGYLQTIVNLAFARAIVPMRDKFMLTSKAKNKFRVTPGFVVLFILSMTPLIIGTVAFSPFLLIELFIGRPLMLLNRALNVLLLKLMEPWKDIYFTGVRAALKGRRTKTKPTDRNLWGIAQKNEVPFLALFGVVCLTAGFVLQLVQ